MGVFMSGVSSYAQESHRIGQVSAGNLSFCADLYRSLSVSEDNIFFSPYSISTALAMTYAGARRNTQKQMAKTLYFSTDPMKLHIGMAGLRETLLTEAQKHGYDLSISNTIWQQKNYRILREYGNLLEKYYRSQIYPVDFEKDTENVRIRINRLVEEQTREKIKDLLKPGDVTALTRLILTNAIYFKGLWETEFQESGTEDADFFLSDGNKTTVPMMHQKGHFGYLETESLQILELPYSGRAISMIVLLPKEKNGLPDIEKHISADNLKKWTPMSQRQVIVYLPRFKAASQFRLNDVLSSMGMPDAFSLPPADFSGISGKRDLFISDVVHQAFIEVTEKGTEAAAATGVVMSRSSIPAPPPVFRADRPFIYMIMDNAAGTVLFFGRLANPENSH
jgi:serpin B